MNTILSVFRPSTAGQTSIATIRCRTIKYRLAHYLLTYLFTSVCLDAHVSGPRVSSLFLRKFGIHKWSMRSFRSLRTNPIASEFSKRAQILAHFPNTPHRARNYDYRAALYLGIATGFSSSTWSSNFTALVDSAYSWGKAHKVD